MRSPSSAAILLLAGGVGLAGCAPRYQSVPSQWVRQEYPALSGNPAATASSAVATAALPASAGPADYVSLALERNPSIAAAKLKVERFAARIPQVTSLDDPMLQVVPIGEMAQTAAGEVGVMTSISQKLPFFGKLDTRGGIAAREVAQAAAELEQAKLAVVADVRRAYWSYYFATQAIGVTQQTRELLRQFREIADTRFRAGQANQADVLRASVELSRLDNELITLDQRKTTAAAMLNSLLDQPVGTPLPPPAPATFESTDLRLQSLLEQSAASSPELAKIRQRIEAERLRHKLASLQRWPDLTVSASYNFVDEEGLAIMANGKDQWWIGFGVNVPIWFDKYAAGEREALRGRQEAIAELGAAQNRIEFQVQDGLVRVQTQQRQVQLFREVIIPQARQTVEASRSSYQAGRTDFLTLVDNWRRLLDYELLYEQNLAELEKSLADLEQVVGQTIERRPATKPVE